MASIISAGTTSGTSLNLSGDTSGVLQLATNGSTTAITVDTSQNVGIGTASPTARLDARGNALFGANARIQLTESAGDAIIGGTAGTNFTAFTVNNTERMRITSAGDVGIGNTAPGAKLEVTGAIRSLRTGSTAAILQVINDNNSWNISSGTSTAQFRIDNNLLGTALTINGNSNIVLAGGTATASGVGITFPATQSASSDANCLDDYEEGTWTPAFGYSGGNGTMSITYANQFGWYTKVGNLVYLRCDLRITSFSKGSASGSPWIVGLPFTPQNNGGYGSGIIPINPYQWPITSTPGVFGSVRQDGVPAIQLSRLVSNSVNANLDDPDGDSMLFFGAVYQT